MSQFFRSCSSKFVGDHSLEDEEYVEKGTNLVKWKMPKVPTHKIYEERSKKIFTFSSKDPSIRTTEGQISYGKNGGAFKLYEKAPSSYGGKAKFYNEMNIGLVQIGVKTTTRKIPSEASIILCLRDNRIDKVQDSIIALVESNLRDGPFYFNVFPNINLSLFDSSLTHVLSVHVLVKGFDQLPDGSEPILLTCRTCYKLNPDNFGAEALLESPVGKTVFFQTKILDDDVVQTVTMWDKVQLPSDWPLQLKIRRLPRMVFSSNGVRLESN